jgi:ActR/RegA family two-component response regulator
MTTVPTKLLLVDDEEDFIAALAERLRIRNYKAALATSHADFEGDQDQISFH